MPQVTNELLCLQSVLRTEAMMLLQCEHGIGATPGEPTHHCRLEAKTWCLHRYKQEEVVGS